VVDTEEAEAVGASEAVDSVAATTAVAVVAMLRYPSLLDL